MFSKTYLIIQSVVAILDVTPPSRRVRSADAAEEQLTQHVDITEQTDLLITEHYII